MNEIVLETQGLTKYYGSTLAVDHLDLKAPRGCICGFVGRNGAGKTTAIKLMLGFLAPTAGSSKLLGCDSTALTPEIRQRIGYVTEGHRLFRWMSIGELERFQRAFFPGQWDKRLFADMIEYFELSRKKKIKHLSNGQRAQVSLSPTEEEKTQRRIKYSLKEVLPDGTIHLVYQPGRTLYSQWEDSAKQQVYDTNDNLLWQGIGKDSPYKYLSWAADAGGDSFNARSMKEIQVITPELSRTLEIPVISQNETIQIWRYAPNGGFFTGYKAGGDKIGYAGATGFEDSKSAVRPFGEFGSFFAWCPKESFSPTLLWQTKRRIYQINFEKRKVELLFESPDADITNIFVYTWDSIRLIGGEPAPGYRPLLYCRTKGRTEDRKHHLVMRGMTRSLTVKTPEEWNDRMNSQIRFTAFEQSVFLSRQWVVESPPLPNYLGNTRHADQLWREYRAAPKKHRLDIYKVDDRGNIELISQFGWTDPGEDLTDQAAGWLSVREKVRRCVSQFSPPMYDLLWYMPGIRMWHSDYDRGPNEILREILILIEQLRPGPSAWNLVISVLMVGFAAWHGRPRRTSRAVFIFWLTFVGLFNLAGLLTYLALNHTPVIKCPTCGKRRGLAQPQCVRCRTDLPAPQPGKLDLIFDTQLKPTT